ncbi:autotransporter assembly complex protein TamA [Niveispirillum sp. KHB5.9]|uniref:autotransporter assembly complex protein TamA n=1 Tax=Niveispirillum sp. KHB5.9 TaxID=3400269 RepID=UPI003A8C7B7E
MSQGRWRIWMLSAAASMAALPAHAQETKYEVSIQGVEDQPHLSRLLHEVSSLLELKNQPPPSPIGLGRRADADLDRFRAALRSEGYYDAIVNAEIDVDVVPAKVLILVEEGARYKITRVALTAPDGATLPKGAPLAEALGLDIGSPARAPAVVDAEGRILPRLAEQSYAYAKLLDRELVVDHAVQGMDVTYIVDAGPEVKFGEVTFNGLSEVNERAARRRLPWRTGDVYHPAAMEEGREALANLGVFSSVRLRLADEPTAENQAPVIVDLAEREMNYVGFGTDYGTEDGFGANAYWGDRNLMGNAEKLRVDASIAGISRRGETSASDFDYRLATTYQQPDFLSRRQSLNLSAEALSERPDAYRRKAVVVTAAVERQLAKGLKASLGITAEQSHIKENTQTTKNTLVGIPAAITWDKSNNLLNPTKGFRLSGAVTPYLAALGDSSSFAIARVGGSGYFDFSDNGKYVAALRGVYGAVIGGGLLDVPADKRFFAGGGGSIRGYGYQEVGPRDAQGEPLGGVSLLEMSAEMRVMVTDEIGVVPFIDAGNVYTTEYPKLGQGLRYAAGIGGRYLTVIGPIRLDVAVPLNKRDGDKSFQFYISIGQAF